MVELLQVGQVAARHILDRCVMDCSMSFGVVARLIM